MNKFLRYTVLLAASFGANAQELMERALLSDYGWHGAAGGVQIHQPTVDFREPYVRVWERTPIGNQYGRWLYVMLVIDCNDWRRLPLGTLDEDGRYVQLADLIGEQPAWQYPKRPTPEWLNMTALCGLYGFAPGTPRPPPGSGHVVR